jgi:hypothetical protein
LDDARHRGYVYHLRIRELEEMWFDLPRIDRSQLGEEESIRVRIEEQSRQIRLLQLIRDSIPRPLVVAKSPMPKHISDKVFEGQECMICLSETTIDTFTLSKCGHSYCNTCYNDDRLASCGECRATAM